MTHPELVPLSRKELSQALNIHTRTLARKIEPLDIPPRERIVPKNIALICEHLNRDEEVINSYIKKNNLKK